MQFYESEGTAANSKRTKRLDPKEAKLRTANYCAYQERTQQQVRDKLYSYGLYRDEVEEVLSELITENFINEERFAKAYAGGKFRVKKWGKIKILRGLQQHNISPYCIKKGMQEIDEDEYIETLQVLLEKKNSLLTETNDFKRKAKLANYAAGKGYEPSLIWDLIKTLSSS